MTTSTIAGILENTNRLTDALADRGVSYIEVRALDVDPFSDVGISEQHFHFLDVFLLYCLVMPSDMMDRSAYQQTEENLGAVVVRGRDPELRLQQGERQLSLTEWAEELFVGFREIAQLLDEANNTQRYSEAVEKQWLKVVNPDETPSGKWLSELLSQQKDNGVHGVELAEQYRQSFLSSEYQLFDEATFSEQARLSLSQQAELESADTKSFDEFLTDYFVETKQVVGKQNIA